MYVSFLVLVLLATALAFIITLFRLSYKPFHRINASIPATTATAIAAGQSIASEATQGQRNGQATEIRHRNSVELQARDARRMGSAEWVRSDRRGGIAKTILQEGWRTRPTRKFNGAEGRKGTVDDIRN